VIVGKEHFERCASSRHGGGLEQRRLPIAQSMLPIAGEKRSRSDRLCSRMSGGGVAGCEVFAAHVSHGLLVEKKFGGLDAAITMEPALHDVVTEEIGE